MCERGNSPWLADLTRYNVANDADLSLGEVEWEIVTETEHLAEQSTSVRYHGSHHHHGKRRSHSVENYQVRIMKKRQDPGASLCVAEEPCGHAFLWREPGPGCGLFPQRAVCLISTSRSSTHYHHPLAEKGRCGPLSCRSGAPSLQTRFAETLVMTKTKPRSR